VNGDPITTSEFERLILESHSKFKQGMEGSGMAEDLLGKRIDDYLILQDALSAGYDEDESLQELVDKKRREYAAAAYIGDNVTLPKTASNP